MSKITKKKLSAIKPNDNNPRTIKEDQFKKLVASLKDFPEMLEARPLVVDPNGVILGGNMRYRAALELGLKEVPVYVATWEEAKQRQFVIKDNVPFGAWDWDVLANDWDNQELNDWGLYVPTWEDAKFESKIEDTGDYDYPQDADDVVHVRMVQLFLDSNTEPNFKTWELGLREKFGTDNMTDTVYAVMQAAYESHYGPA